MTPLSITIILIIVVTVIGAFFKGRSKDLCLKDFAGFNVEAELTGERYIAGELEVEATGIEFIYKNTCISNEPGACDGRSFIMYKNEMSDLEMVIRYHDQLDETMKAKRNKKVKRYYNPRKIFSIKRKIRNFFYTIRDAVTEVITIFIGRFRNAGSAGVMLKGQDKYVSQLQQQMIPQSIPFFEPLLEQYIAKKVILKLKRGEKVEKYSGILKDYSADFIELLEVELKEENVNRAADIIVSRQIGAVRHAGV